MKEKEYRALKLFKALSNTVRYKILKLLYSNNYEVNQIVEIMNKPNSTISNHLKILRDLDLVSYYTKDKNVIYSLRKTKINEIINLAENLFERN